MVAIKVKEADLYSAFIEVPYLLWNVNRKSYAADRSVPVPMTLSDPNLGFKVTV